MSLPPTELNPGLPSTRLSDSSQFRSQMGTISRHSAVFFVGTLFTAVAGYLFKVYLARVLGAEALGLYALGMTITGFVGIFSALGIPHELRGRCSSWRSTLPRGSWRSCAASAWLV